MTSLDQNASDRPYADAPRRPAQAGSAGDGAGRGRPSPGPAVAGSAAENGPMDGPVDGPVVNGPVGNGRAADGVAADAGAPGVVEWSAGAWGVGEVVGRVRPPRRPSPSRRLSQVRATPAASGGYGAAAEQEAAAGVAGVSVELVGVPMGVLIAGSPGSAEAAGPVGRAPDRRVSARLLRFGSGTCQVVLPDWRAAIAVSVPTERLLRSTGLSPEELRSAALSVVINPEAVHDRELGLRDWQAEVPAARGRRRGRRPVR